MIAQDGNLARSHKAVMNLTLSKFLQMNGDDIVACIAISFSNLPRVFGRVKMMLRDNCVQYATYKSWKSLFCDRANTIIHTEMPPILKILTLK